MDEQRRQACALCGMSRPNQTEEQCTRLSLLVTLANVVLCLYLGDRKSVV